MALRVLLADESSTIKKVIQLALQDYAVEVKVVPNGLDVVAVAKQFQPEITFIDVLLTQRSGYDVSVELKTNPETAAIPVVLMWSGFMAVDEKRFKLSRADDRLEKPFETEHLRQLIHKWVPRTSQSNLNPFLQFPKMPDFIQQDDAEDFAHMPLKRADETTNEGWQHHPIKNEPPSNIPEVPNFEADFSAGWGAPSAKPMAPPPTSIPEVSYEDLKFDDYKQSNDDMPTSYEEVSFDTPALPPQTAAPGSASQALLHEKIIREEARQIIENIAWKVIPDIAERILREEIDKILREEERKFQP